MDGCKVVDERTWRRASEDDGCWCKMTWWRASANNGCFGGAIIQGDGSRKMGQTTINKGVDRFNISRGRLKEDGSDDDQQVQLIGSTCALESTLSGLELRSQGKRLLSLLTSFCCL